MFFNRIFLIGGMTALMYGCVSTNGVVSDNAFKNYTSVQELILKRGLNLDNGAAKEYIYDWGPHSGNQSPQSLNPKQLVNAYCQAKDGTFSLMHTSHMPLVQNNWTKRLLDTYGAVKQGIGAYRCVQKDGQQWIVSIEPIAERKLYENQETRVVSLLTRVVTASEAQEIYTVQDDKKASVQAKTVTTRTAAATTSRVAPPKAPEVKKEEKIEVVPPLETVKEEVAKEAPKETVQQQQQRLYLSARRDLNRGANQLAACNQVERAQSLGRFYNASGPNIYTESSVLVARCLTTVPAYQKKFANPQGRAKGILQEVVKMQNHRVAKHMLQQIK